MSTSPNPPAELFALIDRFRRNLDAYRAGAYNETMVRREFIDPFLKLLGWDVDNVKGYAEQYKEVVHEDAIRVGRSAKAPDYSLRIGGVRKLFVEAKKPAVNIKEDVAPAFQLRRYAWSAKLPLSILTDFEEFAVYDCSDRPDKQDGAAHGRILYLRYEEYPQKWDELTGLFAPEAIRRGAFDRFAQAKKAKRGTAEVDDAFLQDISQWREELARNVALRNPGVTTRALNHAVQATIDRIIFLRIAEDRGIEPHGRLRDAAQGKEVYAELGRLFRLADAKYNSGLFYFKPEKGRAETPDTFTLGLAIDDKPLKQIVRQLYYPDSPYQFDLIPADILGQVYEQFLGQVIRLTAGGRAKVEAKPEVKKAGGVFYTPTYIVDAIVAQTVGKLLAERTPGPQGSAASLRILDPACGSGSFLIGAYQYLLDWHLAQYQADTEKWARGRDPAVYQSERGEWKLTIGERKRILLNNIYGVDIDPQAVEVTKLSLLLKVMEGETEATLGAQLRLLPERVLPDLSANVKCGNSLIGPDFYAGRQLSLGLPDEDEMYRINVFDWKAAFPHIVPWGGFDAVIGNPPYIRIQALKEFAPAEVEYYKQAYTAASKGNYDIYVVFVEKGLQLLNRNGVLGFILPHKFFNANYGEPLRKSISDNNHLSKIVHFGDNQIFANATTYTCLLFLTHTANPTFDFIQVENVSKWQESGHGNLGQVPSQDAKQKEWNFVVGEFRSIYEKLRSLETTLSDIGNIFVGTQTSADDVFVLEECNQENNLITGKSKFLDKRVSVEAECTKPFLRGKQIRRYFYLETDARLICPYEIQDDNSRLLSQFEFENKYPLAFSYLKQGKHQLEKRERGKFKGENWYAFGYPKSMTLFKKPKIIVPDYNNVASFTFDERGHFYKTGYGIILSSGTRLSPFYVLGLLNSSLLFQYLLRIGTTLRGGYVRFWTQFIGELPIIDIDLANSAAQRTHDQIVELVTQVLELHKRLAVAHTTHEKTVLQRQIDAADRQIDQLVYQLYDLTPEEIAIVEGQA